MGRAARWLRGFLGGGNKKEQSKDPNKPIAAPVSNNAKRWSFGKSSRDSAEAAAAAAATAQQGGNAAIARAAEAAWLRSVYDETEREQSKHAIAVVRLTSKQGRATAPVEHRGPAAAAVRIQTAFRGFLAKKALRALKALVKLQALVRGYLVRKQAAATLQSMQALVRAQAAMRAHRAGAALPQLNHSSYRPRRSLQERYADDTRSEHGVAAYSRRSIESASSYGFDRSPKIVEMDTGAGCRPKSRSSSRRASSPLQLDPCDEYWCANNSSNNPMSSPLLPPARIAVAAPTPRHGHFPEYDWCAMEKARPATAQSTPRYMSINFNANNNAPATPTKSVCGAGGYLYSSLNCPGYMSSTQSFEAKTRSHSAPKQRPEPPPANGRRQRVPLSEVVVVESSRASLSGAVGMQRSCNRASTTQQEAFNFKTAVVGRLDHHRSSVENDRQAFLQRRW